MKPLDILNNPWAIVPDKLFEIQEIYNTHLRGEKIDLAALEAQTGEPLQSNRQPYQVLDGIAIIPIHGVIAKRMNMFTRISGGVSTQILTRDTQEAIDDPDVKGIIYDIDSGGGEVDGTAELAQTIYKSRGVKPIVAYSDGVIASAAYWIASATDQVFISGDTVQVGSIGVVATHVDYSEYEKKKGIKTTEVYAGKYKRIASEHKPLSDEGLETIQDRVDYIYSVFVDVVAKHRNTNTENVISRMADGRLFIGQQAVSAGLVDGVITFDELLNSVVPQLAETTESQNYFSKLEAKL
jgi:capsid assembly protease